MDSANQVVVAVDPHDQFTVLPDWYSDWFAAALEGCKEGLSALQAEGIGTKEYQVRVFRLIIHNADTSPEAIKAAAFLAIAAAFGVQERFSLVFQDEWQVIPRERNTPPPASSQRMDEPSSRG